MKRAFVIALAVHLCVLLGAGYIYVLPPEKREKLFEMVKIKAPPKPAARKVRIAPPKKIRKPVPMRPVKRRAAKPIQLIAARTDIVPEFTISLPEASQAVYTPEVALVRLPEPVIAEAGGGFWGKEIEMKEKEIELESFGLQNLQPVGTPENPITQMYIQFLGSDLDPVVLITGIGICYPERREIAQNIRGIGHGNWLSLTDITAQIGPYAVPPEDVVFYIESTGGANNPGIILANTEWCRIEQRGPNSLQYNWEVHWPEYPGPPETEYRGGFDDLVFTVTFLGAQGGF